MKRELEYELEEVDFDFGPPTRIVPLGEIAILEIDGVLTPVVANFRDEGVQGTITNYVHDPAGPNFRKQYPLVTTDLNDGYIEQKQCVEESEYEDFDLPVVKVFEEVVEPCMITGMLLDAHRQCMCLFNEHNHEEFVKFKRERAIAIRSCTIGLSPQAQVLRAAAYYRQYFDLLGLPLRTVNFAAKVSFLQSKVRSGYLSYYCGRSPKGRALCERAFSVFSETELIYPFVLRYAAQDRHYRRKKTWLMHFKTLFSFGYTFGYDGGNRTLGFKGLLDFVQGDITYLPLAFTCKEAYMSAKKYWSPVLLFYTGVYFLSADDSKAKNMIVDKISSNIIFEGDCYNYAPAKVDGNCIVHDSLHCWCNQDDQFLNNTDLERMEDALIMKNRFSSQEYYLLECYYKDRAVITKLNELLVPWHTCGFGMVMALLYVACCALRMPMSDKKYSILKYYYDNFDYYFLSGLFVEDQSTYF